MKHLLTGLLLLISITACTPPQQILGSWVNREALPKSPYKSIFILALTQDVSAKLTVENELAKAITARGQRAVRSADILMPNLQSNDEGSRSLLTKAIKDAGCDAVFTVALLDVKSEERLEKGATYYPLTHSYYDSYNRYAFYYYEEVSEPDYYITDNTYFIEGNFYDLAEDKLLWSVQSDSYNPSSLESWIHGYSKLLIKHLKNEGLVKQ
ncbi:MAG: hypothetical protein ACOYN4_02300 [Bacteroidales bacterium]